MLSLNAACCVAIEYLLQTLVYFKRVPGRTGRERALLCGLLEGEGGIEGEG